jgi:hypothetical protein
MCRSSITIITIVCCIENCTRKEVRNGCKIFKGQEGAVRQDLSISYRLIENLIVQCALSFLLHYIYCLDSNNKGLDVSVLTALVSHMLYTVLTHFMCKLARQMNLVYSN